MKEIRIGDLEHPSPGAFKIGPFGSSLKKDELVSSGVPVAGIENVLPNRFLPSFRKYITNKKFADLSDYQIKPGDVLVTTMGTIGRAAVVPDNIGTAIIDSHLFRMRLDDSKVDSFYLSFAINGYVGLQRQLERMARGAIMDGLNTTILKECLIPLPPKNEQKRIAAILDKADRLRRTRRYAQQLSDTFLQSVFVEMFGDPMKNPKGWDTGTLGDVIISAKDGPHVSPEYATSGIPFLSARNVRRGEIIWEDLKYISLDDAKFHWKKCKPAKGDILYTKGGTTGLAKAVDFDREVAVWVHIAVLKLQQDKVVPVWLENMLNSDFCYGQSQELTFGIVNRDLGLQRMPKIKIYIPPKPQQENFARIVRRFERLHTQQREAARQAEHLFKTLLHRAFRGEL